jgi:hypothetical protein
VKTFRNAGDAAIGTAGLWAKDSLRGKRSDPWRRANASPNAVAVPVQGVETRTISHRRVFTRFAGQWRNHQPKRA